MITKAMSDAIEKCVVCWLATIDESGHPNVSPKEAYALDDGKILIANIASPGSVRNIRGDSRVCVSLINIFTQKGYKIKGEARVHRPADPDFDRVRDMLRRKIGSAYPIASVIEVKPTAIEEIVAPSYRLFPDLTELDRVRESLHSYKVAEYQKMADAAR